MREVLLFTRVGFGAIIEPWLVVLILGNGERIALVVEPKTWVDKAAPHVEQDVRVVQAWRDVRRDEILVLLR